MVFNILKNYSDIVKDIRIEKFRRMGVFYQIRAVVFLFDGSELHIKDYLFQDNSRKYSYHWQRKDKTIIGRWDNAPHWPDSKTFPHHFHNGETGIIEDSDIREIEKVLNFIRCVTKKIEK